MKTLRTIFTAILMISGLAAFAQVPNTISPAQKVYGLSRFWEEVNYNFVYLNRIDRKAWDSLYVATIPIVEKTANDYAYYRELQKFCAFLKDGHTNVYLPPPVQNMIMNTMFGDHRLFITNVDGRAIISNTNLSIKQEVPTGSEIISVNGMPTKDYIKQYVSPYISSSTDYVRENWSYSNLLQGLQGQKYDLVIKTPSGQIKDLSVTHQQTKEKEIFPAMDDYKLLELKWYPGDIAYLALNSFGDSKIDSIFLTKLPELYKAKKLIIDLRNNGGGSTGIGVEILKHLTNDSVIYGSKVYTRVHESAFKAWGKFLSPKDTVHSDWNKKAYLDFTDNRYAEINGGIRFNNDVKTQKIIVPTVILVGNNTASAAEDFLVSADNQKQMIKIGQNSFGSTGQPYQFDMPGGGSARVCAKKDTYPDGREFVGYGVKPDIEVKPTVKDYLENNDPALQAALAYLKNKH
jgi:C-terminal processing protease CtpA/Prc